MESTVRKALRERDKMLRDAYRGRNRLSMDASQRAEYERQQASAKAARKAMAKALAAISQRIG